MKHPHSELIKEWLEDTSLKIESLHVPGDIKISEVIRDTNGRYEFSVTPADPYAELKKAQAGGKRVVWQDSTGEWLDAGVTLEFHGGYAPSRYKIVDYDVVDTHWVYATKFERSLHLRFIKNGIDGSIKVEVVS
jgi:hypothetical protein